jgi:hypothetical protein
MHEEFPPVQRLALHLPDQQTVYFGDDGCLLKRKRWK